MNSDFSLVDSNLARAREGLRVLDEIARYVLKDEDSFRALKELRHSCTEFENSLGTALTVGSRLARDVGQERVVNSEFNRTSLWDVIRSNSGRVAESFRVLEEFSKIYTPDKSQFVKDMRYTIYRVELFMLRQTPQFYLHTFFSRGIVYAIAESVEDIQWLVTHGAKVVQLRDKNSAISKVEDKVGELCSFVAKFNSLSEEKVLFMLNDYVDLAAQYPVAGVHIGQDEHDVAVVRRKIGSNKIIGKSNQSLEQLKKSTAQGVDYVSFGPIFATPTKADRFPVGPDMLVEAAQITRLPLVAIGGINSLNVHEIYHRGVKNIAVVRGAKDFFRNTAITTYTPLIA